MVRLILSVATLSLALPSFGEARDLVRAREWVPTPLPINVAKVQSIAAAPSYEGRLYLGSLENGVYRTDSVFSGWSHVADGLPIEFNAFALAVSSEDHGDVLAGGAGSVYRTTDAGESWASTGESFGDGVVRALLRKWNDPTWVLAGVESGAAPGVYRSLDGGQNWRRVLTGLSDTLQVFSLTSNLETPGQVVAATSSSVARTADFGDTWEIGQTATFRTISWDRDPHRLYAWAFGEGVHVSTDSGSTFAPLVPPGSDCSVVHGFGANPWFERQAAVALYGRCYHYSGMHIYLRSSGLYSEDGGESFYGGPGANEYFDGGPPYVVAPIPWAGFRPIPWGSQNTYFLIGEHGEHAEGGLLGSRECGDFGLPGPSLVRGIRGYNVRMVRGDENGRTIAFWGESQGGFVSFRGAGAEAMAISHGEYQCDPGYPWHDYDFFGTRMSRHALDVNQSTGAIYQATSWGRKDYGGSDELRSDDQGVLWQPLSGAGYPRSVYEVVSNAGNDEYVYVRDHRTIRRSEDRGATFQPTASRLRYDYRGYTFETQRSRSLVKRCDDPLHLYALSRDLSVYESRDGAETWSRVPGEIPTSGVELKLEALFASPRDGDHLCVLTRSGEVFETRDGGHEWRRAGAVDLGGAVIHDSTWDPYSGHVFVATAGHGVQTTHPELDLSPLPDRSPNTVHYTPAQGGILYAGTRIAGLYHMFLSLGEGEAPEPVGAGAPATAAASLEGGLVEDLRFGPNPFRTSTTVRYVVGDPGLAVRVEVYDVAGRRLRTLRDGFESPGEAAAEWDGRDEQGRDLPSGIYFLRVAAGRSVRAERLVKLD